MLPNLRHVIIATRFQLPTPTSPHPQKSTLSPGLPRKVTEPPTALHILALCLTDGDLPSSWPKPYARTQPFGRICILDKPFPVSAEPPPT